MFSGVYKSCQNLSKKASLPLGREAFQRSGKPDDSYASGFSAQQQAAVSVQQADSSAQQEAAISVQQADSSAQQEATVSVQQADSSVQQEAAVSVQQADSSAQQETGSSALQLVSVQAQVSHLHVSRPHSVAVVSTAIAVAATPVKIRAVRVAA
jgi:hypothetical protein